MTDFWHNKRVLVTGGNGFLGKYVVRKLHERSTAEIIVPRSSQYDPSTLLRACLRDIAAIRQLFADVQNSGMVQSEMSSPLQILRREHPQMRPRPD